MILFLLQRIIIKRSVVLRKECLQFYQNFIEAKRKFLNVTDLMS